MTEPKEKNAEESDEGSDGAQGSSNRKPKTTIGVCLEDEREKSSHP